MTIYRFLRIKIIFILLFCLTYNSAKSQNDGIKPQIWSNAYVAWNINDKFVIRNALSYNVLLSDELPWNEISYTVNGVAKVHKFMEVSAGFYMARVLQTKSLRSFEYRPSIGFRIFSNNKKRWAISNLTRVELRKFVYSNQSTDLAWRIRNLTHFALSLNKKSLQYDNNLYAFGLLEFFHNFNQEVEERFFDIFKWKLGLGYRLNYNWRFDIGVIDQDSRNTISEPTNLPGNIITNYIIEWGVAYIIPAKKRK